MIVQEQKKPLLPDYCQTTQCIYWREKVTNPSAQRPCIHPEAKGNSIIEQQDRLAILDELFAKKLDKLFAKKEEK